MPRKLRSVPTPAILELGNLSLDPGSSGSVIASAPGKLRVVDARLAADFLHSRIGQKVRRWIPGARRLLRGYDAYQRERATSLARIDHVAVDEEHACRLHQLDDLPIVARGREISVSVTNTGTRALVARVIVEVELP
jgi:hypothetical protein